MKTQASNRWEEQSFLDQDTLLDNLTARASKKVSWNDFFSKKHSKRYYCPNEKRVSGDYTHKFTFSGRTPADWNQAKKIITTMILNRRYMNFDEKLLRLQEMVTEKASFMIKDADQDEDGLIYALKTLDNEFGGYQDSETALVQKLAGLEEMDITNPITIDNFKFSVMQLIRLLHASNRHYEDHEQLILAHQRFEPKTRLLYDNFRQSNRQQNNSLRLFFCWAKYYTNKMHDSMQAKAIVDDWRRPEQSWKQQQKQEQPRNQAGQAGHQRQEQQKALQTSDTALCAVTREEVNSDTEDILCALRDALKMVCICCGLAGHKVMTCNKFEKYTDAEKHAMCEKEGLCKRCLRGIHPISNCYRKDGCTIPNCGSMDHHAKLHRSTPSTGSGARLTPEEKDSLMKQVSSMLKKIEEDKKLAEGRADTVGLTSDQGQQPVEEPEDFCGFAHGVEAELGKLWRTIAVNMSMTRSFKAYQRSNMLIDEGSSATIFNTETSVKR
jgi:hypothetical protein